jgi:hypothetical protein
LVYTAFVELLRKIDTFDLECRWRKGFREHGVGGLKTGAVEIGAKRKMQSQ